MDRNRWWLVAGMGLVIFMATLDTSIVAVALPALEHDFGVRAAATEWVVLGYLLPLVALTLPAGRWLDTVGTRAALVFAVGGFTLASLAAGLAPTLPALVAARLVQGAFAGTLFALVPMIVMRAVRPGLAGRASALVMTLGPLGAVSGPAAGGFIVQSWGWPWIFYINLPAGLAVLAIAVAQLPSGLGLRRPDRTFLGETLLLGAAAAALLLGLSLAASHGLPWLALGLAAGAPLVLWWRSAPSRPVRDLARVPAVTGPVVMVLMNAVTVSLVEFLAPFYLQRTLGLSAAATGAAILAFPVGMVAAGPVGGLLADRWGAARTAGLGIVVAGAGTALMLPLDPGWHPAELSWRLALLGAGSGLFAGPNFTMIMMSAPAELQGTAGAAQSLARQLGFSFGPALATTAWALSGYTLTGMRAGLVVAVAAAPAALLALRFGTRPARATAQASSPERASLRGQ